MRRRQIGLQLDRAPVARDRPLELFLLIERIGEMKVSVEVIAWRRSPGAGYPPPLASGCPLQHRPEIVMRHGKAGIEFRWPCPSSRRLVQSSEAGKRYSEFCAPVRRRVEPDGLVQQLDRLLVIATLNRGDPEQVMRAGMQGMTGDRFLCGGVRRRRAARRHDGLEPPRRRVAVSTAMIGGSAAPAGAAGPGRHSGNN